MTLSDRLLHPLLTRISGGTLEVVDADGVERFGDHAGRDPIDARVVVHDRRLAGRVLRGHSIALGESYADGWWDTDDLTALLRLAHRNLSRTHEARDAWHRLMRPVVDPVARRRPPDPHRDARNVRSHYDLGNALFSTLLDPSMMYSSAYFESADATLAEASRAKLERIVRRLELGRDDHVLEIGTGWGGFAVFAAATFGCRVTTTTISVEQYEYARRRVREAGLDHLVTVRADDYRDLDGTFDRIVAIEMIEAVDWREYDAFFASVRRLLADDGLAALQAIVVPDRSFDRTKRRTDFIKAAIFPGGCLPSESALTRAAARSGLRRTGSEDFGLHYAETLRRWRGNLHADRDALATRGYDERFARLWDFYFAYCEAGFEERYISVVQLAYAAPGRRIPSTRREHPREMRRHPPSDPRSRSASPGEGSLTLVTGRNRGGSSCSDAHEPDGHAAVPRRTGVCRPSGHRRPQSARACAQAAVPPALRLRAHGDAEELRGAGSRPLHHRHQQLRAGVVGRARRRRDERQGVLEDPASRVRVVHLGAGQGEQPERRGSDPLEPVPLLRRERTGG